MRKKVKAVLKKRIDINWPLPNNKFGNWLRKDAHLVPNYFKESKRELKKVIWPSRKETWKLFLAVIVFSVALAAVITLVDFIFSKLIERIYL